MTQAIEHLPSKLKVQSSNPSSARNKKKEKGFLNILLYDYIIKYEQKLNAYINIFI
jgi:hypothetical protein